MRRFLLCLLLQLLLTHSWAQLTITPGAQLYMNGTADLTLQNTDLVNNGTFKAGQGVVYFTGNTQVTIGGTQPINFYQLALNKSGSQVNLQRSISASDRVLLSAGLLSLFNYNLNLGNTGWLSGESEAARITSLGSGKVIAGAWISASGSSNPGNLGAVFSASQNLGYVTVSRGHNVQVTANVSPATVKRYYDIVPSNGSSLTGTLRLHYLDAELNGTDENSMALYRSTNKVWMEQSTSGRSAIQNYLEVSGSIPAGQFAMANGTLPIAASQHTVSYTLRETANTAQSSGFLKQGYDMTDVAFKVWPNPSRGSFFLAIYSEDKTTVTIRITDGKGALVKMHYGALVQGLNQLSVDISSLPAGTYTVQEVRNNSQPGNLAKIVKL